MAKVIVEPDATGYEAFRAKIAIQTEKVLGRPWTGRLLFLPDFAVFLLRLMADPRAPLARKLVAGASLGYLVLPLDLSPDVLPLIGWLDDVAFLALSVQQLIQQTDPEVVAELWPNKDVSALDAVEKTLTKVSGWMPRRIWRSWMQKRLF